MQIIPKIIQRIRLKSSLNYTTVSQVGNKFFKIPLLGEMGYDNLSITEPWMTELLKKLDLIINKKNAVFVDVGVNTGQTLLKLRSVYPELAYVGFEPNPTCVFYVKELIKANDFKNVRLFPVGISNKAAVIELQMYSDNVSDSCASIITDFRPEQKVFARIPVPVFTSADIDFEGIVSLVKIDVEGAELEVIQGFQKQINSDHPLILMEILPVYTKENTFRIERQRALESILRGSGYHCLRVRKTASNKLDKLESLSQIEVHGEIAFSDYLWIPDSKFHEVLALLA